MHRQQRSNHKCGSLLTKAHTHKESKPDDLTTAVRLHSSFMDRINGHTNGKSDIRADGQTLRLLNATPTLVMGA